MRNEKFKGTSAAVVTPFNPDGSVDYTSLEKLIEKLITDGLDYLVALGTTAETPTLTKEEKLRIVETFIRVVDTRVPIVVGAGGNNTAEVISWIQELDKYPVQGYLCVAPYYNKPGQKALEAHFSSIAENCTRPIVLYNVPGRTASNIEAQTVITLVKKYEHIVAVKEASGSLPQIMEIIAGAPDGFYVLSGDDALTLAMMSVGAQGVVSVIAQAYPSQYVKMISSARRGDFETARAVHYEMLDVTNSIYVEGNPTGIKYLLSAMGLCANELRLPMIKASTELENTIKGLML